MEPLDLLAVVAAAVLCKKGDITLDPGDYWCLGDLMELAKTDPEQAMQQALLKATGEHWDKKGSFWSFVLKAHAERSKVELAYTTWKLDHRSREDAYKMLLNHRAGSRISKAKYQEAMDIVRTTVPRFPVEKFEKEFDEKTVEVTTNHDGRRSEGSDSAKPPPAGEGET